MSLINYVQAAPNGDGASHHVQVTGPAFPTGYASGDLTLTGISSGTVFIPSMRGSSRLYFQLTTEEVKRNLSAIVEACHAPSPQYTASQGAAVTARVVASQAVAAKGLPKPTPTPAKAAPCEVSEEQISKIVKAVLAILKA